MNLAARTAALEQENQYLKAELNTSQKRCEQYAAAFECLQHQLNELRRYRFGKKAERFIDEGQLQINLFGSTAEKLDEQGQQETAQAEQETEVAAYKRKKRGNKNKDLPVRIEIVPVREEDKQCACGACKAVIRYETKQLLHYQACVHEIIEQRREVVACPKGCDGAIVTAPAPLHVLPKTKVTEEFLSFLVTSKIDDRQPLYHLEKQLLHRHGIDCSRQTMSRWLIDLMQPLRPIYNLLKDHVIEYDVASCDATTLQVLKEPGRRAETKSYVYCMRGGPPGKGVTLYDYNHTEHRQFVLSWFEGFKGHLHVDGDNFFNLIGQLQDVYLVNCNGHARRKFEPIAKNAKKPGAAKEALSFFKALYKIEREAKDNNLTALQRHALRQQKSRPLLEQFKQWLDETWPTVLPKSPLGVAINYCLKLWPGLVRFLEDGRLEVDNNLTEQKIKPFVIARKNFLFSASMAGAHALCLHFGLVQTAKQHGLDPYHYYVKLLKSVPHCSTVEDYEKLLPWNIKSDYAKLI